MSWNDFHCVYISIHKIPNIMAETCLPTSLSLAFANWGIYASMFEDGVEGRGQL